MLTFTLNSVDGSDAYATKVWDTIMGNLGYFRTFNGVQWHEAVQRAYIIALDHRDINYEGSLLPYIKKLARTVLKVKSYESAYGVYTDEGEISPVYHSLTSYIDTSNLDDTSEIMPYFEELYLLDSESFMKLKSLYIHDDVDSVENLKSLRIKNQDFNNTLRSLVTKYGSDFTFKALYEFFQELPYLIDERGTHVVQEITMRKCNYSALKKIPDTPLIVDDKNRYHMIDKNTLTMSLNPDYDDWDIVGTSTADILRIDISPYMDYMYLETFAPVGVNTRHLTWCGSKYRLETPGGDRHVSFDKNKFINLVRIELVVNLLMENIGTIVALSADSVYIKPTRSFKPDNLRVTLQSGKVFDLPITVRIRKKSKRKVRR